MAQRHLVGLDIGSKFIKAVQLTQTAGQYKVTEFGIAEVSPQVSVPDTVNELFAKKNFKTKRVVSAVSGRFVFVRYISMPVRARDLYALNEPVVYAVRRRVSKRRRCASRSVFHDHRRATYLRALSGGIS